MLRKNYLLGVLLCCLVLTALTEDARALPVFARKYETSCATCHEVFPRLNATGQAFRLNGYRFTDDEIYIKEEPVELGDEAYKRLWPNAIWPSDIPGLPLFSLRILNDFTADTGGTAASRTTFDYPHEIEIYSAGAFGDNVSFFSEVEFEGGETEIAGLLGFHDLFGSENTFNVRVGNIMQGMWGGLLTALDSYRFTRNNYLYADWRLPYPSTATQWRGDSTTAFPTTSSEEKNTYRVRSGGPGVELNGFDRSWYYAVGVLEGDTALSDKDFFGQVAYKIGGIGFDGSGADLGEEELTVSTESWRDDSLILSGWFHTGKRLVNHTVTGASASDREDDFWRTAAGLLWRTGDLQLGGGYFLGENDNPYGTVSSASIDSDGWFVESSYFYKPWLVPTLRYEIRDLDIPSGGVGTGSGMLGADQDLGRVIASVKILVRANVALTLEQRIMTTNQGRSSGTTLSDENMFWARLDFAF